MNSGKEPFYDFKDQPSAISHQRSFRSAKTTAKAIKKVQFKPDGTW